MKKGNLLLIFVLLCVFKSKISVAQIASTSYHLKAQPIYDRSVIFDVNGTGVSKPIIWGLDLAWLSEGNIRRGIAFMDKENVGVIRSSFMPTNPLLNDQELQGDALTNTNLRINIIKKHIGSGANVVLNSDHPSVDSYFQGNASNWAKLIEVTAKMHESEGFNIVTVSPFNEPDLTETGQGTLQDFYNICGIIKNNSYFDNIRVSGGNTLNPDVALNWYDYLKSRLDEGNTHQLAGSFDNYASFYTAVRADGNHATNDELHNVMEAMVGVEYGLQTGIWWYTAEYARGEFCKASNGVRLGYAEHRPNWTSASVYRHPNGKVQAFGGTSERQAITTKYCYVSKNQAVFFDGYGPQHDYVLELPGGTGYQQGQTNAERVINITWGDDIQPIINGRYKLINRNQTSQVLDVNGAGSTDGTNVQIKEYLGQTSQQWDVIPVSSRIGGDFSYFSISPVNAPDKTLDVNNWSLDNAGNIHLWTNASGGNQQWYLEYQDDGWFLIRSRHSALCLSVTGENNFDGANVIQYEYNGSLGQQWRFLPVDAPIEFDAPSAPANLEASINPESIQLNWTASPESDVEEYIVYRSESSGGPYNTIAQHITGTSFVDNTATSGITYYYVVKSKDYSLNRSVNYSNEISAMSKGSHTLVAQYKFEDNLEDSSINLNHSASFETVNYVDGHSGGKALSLNGMSNFFQLSPNVANYKEITIAAWVYWKGGNSWQRIFDFGNSQSEYMFLTPSSGGGQLHFGIRAGSAEQILTASALPTGEWVHVAVVLSDSKSSLYVNGTVVAESASITTRPIHFKPVLNYIGRSQWPDPLLNGNIDDFRIYNYAFEPSQISALHDGTLAVDDVKLQDKVLIWPIPARDVLYVKIKSSAIARQTTLTVYDLNGRPLINGSIKNGLEGTLDVSNLAQGVYILKLNNNSKSYIKKFIVKH
ncbi:LamG-like jellyroll fold domain-containing protein [Aestuariibaculum suncheonense]|uniref:RICIN domain-containing protein n=1 Tax=Aestuariibaculum suncheonense TaxID=1028745 RepID=A0A8J6QC55_9FLAO|nr:LamG-like jellyroll fold domain-containing protein [Aestuariibaculum suncheonense]MBD0834845.1 RICIN domain-containing protein [Aestuariibaculum suncheonense]